MFLGKLGLKVKSKVLIYTNLDFLLTIKLHVHLVARFTESQNGRGWKGPLWVIESNPSADGSLMYFCIKPALSVAGNYENH